MRQNKVADQTNQTAQVDRAQNMTSQEFWLLIGALQIRVAFQVSLFGHHVMIIITRDDVNCLDIAA